MKKLAKLAALIAAFALALTLGACDEDSEESSEGPSLVLNKGTVNITFDANGGSITNPTTISEEALGAGCKVTLPTAETLGLSRSDYAFIGWATDQNATAVEYTDGEEEYFYIKDTTLTLYAVWKQGYAATKSTICDVIKGLTGESATVVVTGILATYSYATEGDVIWQNIAAALSEVPDVKVTLDLSESEIYDWGNRSFSTNNNLVAVVLPNKNGYAATSTFYNCESLASVTVSDDNQSLVSVDGVLYNKNKTRLLFYPAGKTDTSFTMPDTVTTIVANAFCANKHLKSVTTPDGINTIEKSAFSGMTALETVTLGADLTRIEPNAFEGCTALTEAVFKDTECYWTISEYGYEGYKYSTGKPIFYSYFAHESSTGAVVQSLTQKKRWDLTTNSYDLYRYCDCYWDSLGGTITYEANGGTFTAAETTQRYKYYSHVALKSAEDLGLTRSGYTFKGWSRNADASDGNNTGKFLITYEESDFLNTYSESGEDAMTLYAVWEADAE